MDVRYVYVYEHRYVPCPWEGGREYGREYGRELKYVARTRLGSVLV